MVVTWLSRGVSHGSHVIPTWPVITLSRDISRDCHVVCHMVPTWCPRGTHVIFLLEQSGMFWELWKTAQSVLLSAFSARCARGAGSINRRARRTLGVMGPIRSSQPIVRPQGPSGRADRSILSLLDPQELPSAKSDSSRGSRIAS